ncbi:MAG: sensor histidine kinase [Bacteroidia bacterium]|nr:sensor histidine kinase [Bacteroidia bacterium]
MKPLIIIIALVISLNAFASNTDSLLTVLANQTDTNEVKTLNELCYAYVFDDIALAKNYGFNALNKAQKQNYTLGIAKAHIRIGIAYDISTQYDSCIYHYNIALTHYQKINDTKGKASALNNLAMVYNNIGDYQKALQLYFEALKVFETIGDKLGEANALNNIAILYLDTNKPLLALQYLSIALPKYKNINHKTGIAAAYTNISLAYNDINVDSSIFYGKKAIEIKQELNDQYGLGISYNDLALAYIQKKQYEVSLALINKSLAIKQSFNDKFGIASTLLNRSSIYTNLNRPKLAIKDLIDSYKAAKLINSYRLLTKISISLAKAYKNLQDNSSAYLYMTQYATFRDSLMSEETNKQINELETRYQTEKKDLEIANKQLELQKADENLSKKRTQLLLVVALLITFILATLLFYFSYTNKLKRKAIELQVEQEKQRNIAIIAAEDEERKRIAKDLHDGAGQHLSAVKMNLSAFAERQPAQELNNVMNLLDDAVKEVRNVSHMMMPAVMLTNGLCGAIQNLVSKINGNKSIQITTQFVDLDNKLSEKIQTTVYRITQESLNNIIKHAQATIVDIQLIQYPDYLLLMIEDNGKGFDLANISHGMGLRNIESRALYINAKLHIDSSIGNGTTLTLEIPT